MMLNRSEQNDDFMQSNFQMQEEKKSALKQYNDEKYKERMDYFPFVYGDRVEKHRKVIEALQRKEMNDLHAQRMKVKEEEAEKLKLQIEFNRFRQAHKDKQNLDKFIQREKE